MSAAASQHPMSLAREYALQFLYQCETERVFYFSEAHFERFSANFELSPTSASSTRRLVEGALGMLDSIDELIRSVSQNWSLERMAATDRSVLRVACYELMKEETPPKVVLNEAIELAKKFGTEQSGAFVNGLLNKIASQVNRR